MADLFVNDFTGERIRVGDEIAYPTRTGSAMWLNAIVVTAIIPIRAATPVFKIVGTNMNGNKVTIRHPERCVILFERPAE